jgi:hypothetical protein
MKNYSVDWPEDGPTIGELRKEVQNTWNQRCEIDARLQEERSKLNGDDLKKDGPSWSRIVQNIDVLTKELNDIDNKFVSLKLDMQLYTGVI